MLVAFEAKPADRAKLSTYLDRIGFRYWEETGNRRWSCSCVSAAKDLMVSENADTDAIHNMGLALPVGVRMFGR